MDTRHDPNLVVALHQSAGAALLFGSTQLWTEQVYEHGDEAVGCMEVIIPSDTKAGISPALNGQIAKLLNDANIAPLYKLQNPASVTIGIPVREYESKVLPRIEAFNQITTLPFKPQIRSESSDAARAAALETRLRAVLFERGNHVWDYNGNFGNPRYAVLAKEEELAVGEEKAGWTELDSAARKLAREAKIGHIQVVGQPHGGSLFTMHEEDYAGLRDKLDAHGPGRLAGTVTTMGAWKERMEAKARAKKGPPTP